HSLIRLPPSPTLFPSTTLFRSTDVPPVARGGRPDRSAARLRHARARGQPQGAAVIRFENVSVTYDGADEPSVRGVDFEAPEGERSEEHTSELQSRENLVCRLLL